LFNRFFVSLQARRAIRLRFEHATTDRLRTLVTLGTCVGLHYSGHGDPNYLSMEDGRGGAHFVQVQGLKTRTNQRVKGPMLTVLDLDTIGYHTLVRVWGPKLPLNGGWEGGGWHCTGAGAEKHKK